MKRALTLLLVFAVLFAFALFAIASGSSDGEEKEISSAESTDNSKEITIEEQVLIDDNGLVVTAKEYVKDSIWGDGIKLLIENNTDSDVTLTCDDLIVNDYMLTDLFSETVSAGKKANTTVYLSSTQLDAAGISNVGKVEIYFRTYNPETYDTIKSYGVVTIKTSVFDIIDVEADNIGAVLYENNGVKVVGKYVDEDSFWGTSVILYIENNRSENISLHVDNMSVNGFMNDCFFYSKVLSGKKSVDDITVFSSDLEENGIEKITDIEFDFYVTNADNYDRIIENETVKINMQ